MTEPYCPLLSKKAKDLLRKQWEAYHGGEMLKDENGEPTNIREAINRLAEAEELYVQEDKPVPNAAE